MVYEGKRIETPSNTKAAFHLVPSRIDRPCHWDGCAIKRVVSCQSQEPHSTSTRPLIRRYCTGSRRRDLRSNHCRRAPVCGSSDASLSQHRPAASTARGRGVKGARGVVTQKRRPVADSIIRYTILGFQTRLNRGLSRRVAVVILLPTAHAPCPHPRAS